MNILEIKNLVKRYGNIMAVDGLTVTISRGSVFGILGPNGSGKTTTLAVILGIVRATSGSFSWFDYHDGELANKRIGAIIEQPNFYPYLSAIRNLEIVAEIRGILREDLANEMKRVLKIVQLWDRRTDAFAKYSFGMKSRLALAATLLGNPEVLVFDEPTNGLDPAGIALIRQIIMDEAKTGKTIILASHILDEVEKVCSDVLILKEGKQVVSGSVQSVLKDDEKIHIVSDDNKKLHELLVRNDMVETAEFNDDYIIIVLKKTANIRQISEIAMDNRIIVTKLETKKKTLEAEFLELVK